MRRTLVWLVLAGCHSHHEDVAPSPPVTGDPCPIDFGMAQADAWPQCSALGPLGLERTYFQIGIHPCRIDNGRGSFTQTWGPGGRLERQTYAKHVTTYHYDASGKLVSADDVDPPDHSAITYSRDGQGRLIKVDDGTRTTTYTRDEAGNVTAIESSSGGNHDHATIQYDKGLAVSAEVTTEFDGRVAKKTTTVERDAQGRRTRSMHHGEAMDETIVFTFDGAGRVGSLVWTTEIQNGGHDETTISATYDSKGRLATLDEGGRVMTYHYDCP